MSGVDGVPVNCVGVKDLAGADLGAALKALVGKIKTPVGIGIWHGTVRSHGSGAVYGPEHVAVMGPDALVSPFGPRGDETSEAAAALFVTVVQHVDVLVEALEAGS